MKQINYNETLDVTNFYKVNENGGCYITGTFYNPDTDEYFDTCIRDYDYADKSRDKDELYYKPFNEEVAKMFYHKFGKIYVGDTVEVYKGRKVPKGTIGTVNKIYDWKDQYGRTQATYVVFNDGTKTNINNCRLIVE